MKRHYYLRGNLVEVDQVDDVVAVRGAAPEADLAHGVDTAAAVRTAVPGVDEESLAAFAAAGWRVVAPAPGRSLADVRTVSQRGDTEAGAVLVVRGGRVAIATDLLNVQLAGDPSEAETDAILTEVGLAKVGVLRFAPHLYEVRATSGDALDASVALHDDPRFVFAEPSLLEHIPGRFSPTDPRYDEQWQWNNTGQDGGTPGADVSAEEAWDHTFGAGIRVAVVDNGFDATHEDLAAGIAAGSGFFQPGSPATFTSGTAGMPAGDHGTFCAGMVGARSGNGHGGVGAAPQSDLMLVACLGDQVGTQTTLARAIAYAADPTTEGGSAAHAADIIVSSLGPNGAEWDLTSTLDLALVGAAANGRGGLGTAIFWAASNGNNVDVLEDEVVSHADVIAVVRSTNMDLENNAARGPEVELIAPGVNVVSTNEGDDYGPSTGTSFAAPCAAGCAALALSVRPTLTRDGLREIMRTTADQIGGVVYDASGHNDDYGFGRVNAFAAVRAAARNVTLVTDPIVFNDVPEGETTARSVTWDVEGVEDLTFEVTGGPTTTTGPANSFQLLLGPSVTVPAPGVGVTAQARIWLTYTGTTAGDTATGTIVVHSVETDETWTVDLQANTIERPTAAVVMVLDKSASMEVDAGDGRTRVQVLRDSAGILIDTLREDTGVGIVRFDHDATSVMSVTDAGPETFGAGRAQAAALVASHVANPAGNTSIGDGVLNGGLLLDAVAPAYDTTAMIVLTDGQETAPAWIADVAGTIDDKVFAIGLGSPSEINPVALTALTDGTGGYVNVTGNLSADEQFLLAKYYLQILAGVTNDQVVLDPDGYLQPGDVVKVPFDLTSADISSDVILLTPVPDAVGFTIVAPSGATLSPTASGVTFVQGAQVAYYRFTLPQVDAGGTADWAGTWVALLEIDERVFKDYLKKLESTDPKAYEHVAKFGLRWVVEVHSRSNVHFGATLEQTSTAPGAVITVKATVDEMQIPVGPDRVSVNAEVTTPSGPDVLALDAVEDGVFVGKYTAQDFGLYTFRVIADGTTLRNEHFTREQTLSGAVYVADKPKEEGGGATTCDRTIEIFVETVKGNARLAKSLDGYLRRNGSSLEELLTCLGGGNRSDQTATLADALRAAAAALESR